MDKFILKRQYQIRKAQRILQSGGVIAYPTEGVYGLGCLPQEIGVKNLLRLKKRSPKKGFILLASSLQQLSHYLSPRIYRQLKQQVQRCEQEPISWVVPARKQVPLWLKGAHHSLAVRLSKHPIPFSLCRQSNSPLISTSANISHQPSAINDQNVRDYFHYRLDLIIKAPTGVLNGPTEIRDLISGKCLRASTSTP